MYPYTKELTLDEALNILTNAKCQSYEKDGKVYLTALDYATHILKQNAPPEGWGYPNKELKQGTYTGLHWGYYGASQWDIIEDEYFDTKESIENWNKVCFKLTDLAKVEQQTEAPIQPTTDWEVKYKELEKQADQYKSDFEVAVKLNKTLCDNHIMEVYDLRVEIDKLKNYIINQLITN
jgi:hypothetical protein